MNDNEYILSIDNLRLQVTNPCVPWDNKETIKLLDINGREFSYSISRANCYKEKIVAWLSGTTFIWDQHINTKNYNLGKNDSGQVVGRIIGGCQATESRSSVLSAKFEPMRHYVSAATEDAVLYCCDRCKSFTVSPDFSIIHSCELSGRDTPIQDKEDNNISGREHGGLKDGENKDYIYVEYGTKNMDDDYWGGNIKENCITDTENIYFLYIPCGHYLPNSDGNAKPKYIEGGAFKNLTNLRGLWIDSGYNGYFSYDSGTDPFSGCGNLEIVYCPSGWENYFIYGKDGNNTPFANIKFINGTPYEWNGQILVKCI